MSKLDGFLTRDEAAEILGVHRDTIKRLVSEGRLIPYHKQVGNNYLYERSEVMRTKQRDFPDGISYGEIAAKYGLARNTVKQYLAMHRVKPIGLHRKRSHVFDPVRVAELARFLGWQESQTSAASDPNDADAADRAPS